MAPTTRSSRTLYDHFDPGPTPDFDEQHDYIDVEMTIEDNAHENKEQDVMEHDPVSNIERDRIVISIDFGTTFSTVAYAVLPKGVSPKNIHVRKVKCIGKFPGYRKLDGMLDTRQDVPTELWYNFEDQPLPSSDLLSPDLPSNDEASSSSDDDGPHGDSSGPDDDDPRVNRAARHINPRNTSVTQYWGFNVQQHLNTMNIPRDEVSPLTRFKLKLDNTEATEKLRADLDTILSTLRQRNIINDDSDIYTDYLTHLLKHAKEQLELSKELCENMVVQFVLCVPAKWPVKACRTMQSAVEQAVQRAGFNSKTQEASRNLFMISEPEAAAECILAEARSDLYRDETVVIVDAGGGTIDAVTYKCANDDPLRLSEEVVAPDSELFGASFINKAFEDKLEKKLEREQYLVQNGKTLKSIIQKCATEFEDNEKRRIDIYSPMATIRPIYIDNLRENPRKHFYQNRLQLKKYDNAVAF
ncbi:hypothetical protein SLS60_005768 [Paraconiothyrium brasiliense]|uniref:Hsp70 family protein n=1 Tax=Paraconiothyrium brasiliense TaxID=300254 RepID=A0ABR3REM7_9PLEO